MSPNNKKKLLHLLDEGLGVELDLTEHAKDLYDVICDSTGMVLPYLITGQYGGSCLTIYHPAFGFNGDRNGSTCIDVEHDYAPHRLRHIADVILKIKNYVRG